MCTGLEEFLPAIGDIGGGGAVAESTGSLADALAGTGAVTEAGIFNAGSGGTMLCRTTFPAVNKASGDSIAITWVVTVS